MKIDKEENSIANNNEMKELKDIVDSPNSNVEDEIQKDDKEEILEEEKQNLEKKENRENTELTIEKSKEETEEELLKGDIKKSYIDESSEPIGKKELKSLLLILNSYWIELLGSISLLFSLLILGFISFIILMVINPTMGNTGDSSSSNFIVLLSFLLDKLGFKWFFFITMGNHLSVGFFSLSTFTSVLRDTKNIKKFYIVNFIKFGIFYALNIVVLKLIMTDVLLKIFNDRIIDIHVTDTRVNTFFEIFIEKLVNYVGRFLATYNIFLEKIVFGTMYIFLFNKPKNLEGKKLLYFRLLALIPVIFTILSLIFRALHYSYKDDRNRFFGINIYVLPLLLGSKIGIYMFYISTLSIIKYMSLKKEVFDEENNIQPRIFSKIGSRCFGIMGIVELIIGLFLPSWSTVGIGEKYLLIICAPILALYDYKRKYKLKFPCCKKGNMSLCFRLVFLNVAFLVIIIFYFLIIAFVIMAIGNRMEDVSFFIIDNNDLVNKVMDMIL